MLRWSILVKGAGVESGSNCYLLKHEMDLGAPVDISSATHCAESLCPHYKRKEDALSASSFYILVAENAHKREQHYAIFLTKKAQKMV